MRPRLQQLLHVGLRMKKTCGANHWAMAVTQTEECTFVKHPQRVCWEISKEERCLAYCLSPNGCKQDPSGVRKWQYSHANWAGGSIQTSSCCPRCNWAWFWKRHHSKQVKNHHTHKAYCQQYPHASLPSAFHPTKFINLITHVPPSKLIKTWFFSRSVNGIVKSFPDAKSSGKGTVKVPWSIYINRTLPCMWLWRWMEKIFTPSSEQVVSGDGGRKQDGAHRRGRL